MVLPNYLMNDLLQMSLDDLKDLEEQVWADYIRIKKAKEVIELSEKDKIALQNSMDSEE
jgi:hypothetical protein